ncbi:MAG: helix-turn-helix domain-containing protein [Ignavibacteriales bacterium]
MAEEVGIDFDELIDAIANDLNPVDMSEKFGISEDLAGNFKEIFFEYGISSVMGGD